MRSLAKRRLRKHYILNVIREHGPLSRADISKVSGYNLRSISSLVDELVHDGLVMEQQAIEVPRGRRPIPVSLNNEAACVIGLHVGKRRTTGHLLDLGANPLSEMDLRNPPLKSAEDICNWVIESIYRLLRSGNGKILPLGGIGLALPTVASRGAAGPMFILQECEPLIRRRVEAEFGIPVLVDDEGAVLGVGALWFGSGRVYKHFAVLKLGYGLSLGLISNGKIVRGAPGFGVELGQVPMGEVGVSAPWGGESCLENVASGSGMERLAREAGLGKLDAKKIFQMHRDGDKSVGPLVDAFSEGVAKAMATIVNLYGCQAIIITGGLSHSHAAFLQDAVDRMNKYAVPPISDTVDIIPSEIADKLGPMGAAAIVLHHIFRSSHVELEEVI